jgi:hypothetical protein
LRSATGRGGTVKFPERLKSILQELEQDHNLKELKVRVQPGEDGKYFASDFAVVR